MQQENLKLTGNKVYHIYTKSISGFRIFNDKSDFLRMQQVTKYYRLEKPSFKFSRYLSLINHGLDPNVNGERIVDIVAYCIMGTHVHLILKQLKEGGISNFLSNVLNSYTRYFNIKHNRKGPLWETRFKRVLVSTDEQLLHLTRYIHLNPVTAFIVNSPADWAFSSYLEYVSSSPENARICNFKSCINIDQDSYRKFVEDYKDLQRSLAKIKNVLMDHDSTS